MNGTLDGMPNDDEGWVPVDGLAPQEERRYLDDLDLMGEVTHPIRGLILRRLKEPRTVADLAALLDVPITRLYHHVNRLVDIGLIRVVATRQVAAVTERRYQTVAMEFSVDAELINSTDKREVSAAMGSLFDVAKIGFQRFVESGAFSANDDDDSDTVLSLAEVHLTEPRRAELMRRLTEVLKDFRSDASDTDPDAAHIHLFIAVSPEAK